MREFFEKPVVKWSVMLVVVAGGALLVTLSVINTFGRGKGYPRKETIAALTCTNKQCPGRSHDTAPMGSAPDVLGPHQFRQKVWTDFGDWPMTCPKCGQESIYLKMEVSVGTYVTVHKLTGLSVILPSGKIIIVESPSSGPWRDPETGESATGNIWQVPQR